MRVYLATLGCKLNESELEAWSRRFASDGYEVVSDPREADICVLNTCTVTHVAARKSRQLARQLARANPEARLVLTGCYASVTPDDAKSLPNVALVVPNADKDRLVTLAGAMLRDTRYQTTETGCRLPEAASGVLASAGEGELASDHRLWSADGGQPHTAEPPPDGGAVVAPTLRTRAFVKIQDGCNMSCTYCIIPLARGSERSRPLGEIVAEVQALTRTGYQEIVLTGVQISVYENNGDKAHGLRDLVAALLGEVDVPRLRLTSIAPWDLDESLLDLWRDPRLCRHLHLSLQSGCDTVLRRMRRGYNTAQYARAVELARSRIPDVGITTDVIVGFPGESDTEFEAGRAFVEAMAFSRIHVFPYSARQGTLAATMPLQVPDAVQDSRVKEMQALAEESARAFAARFVGRRMDVLWESREPAPDDALPSRAEANRSATAVGRWSGYTDNYIRVATESDADLHNRITSVDLTALGDDGAVGQAPS